MPCNRYSSIYFPGDHTHHIALGPFDDSLPRHTHDIFDWAEGNGVRRLRMRTAQEFSLPLARVDEMTNAELLLRAEVMHIE